MGGLVVLALAVLLLPLWLDGGGLKTPSVQPVPEAPVISQPAQIAIPTPPPAQQQMLENPPASSVPPTEPNPVAPHEPSGDSESSIDAASSQATAPSIQSQQTPAIPAQKKPAEQPSPTVGSSVLPKTEKPIPAAEKPESAKTAPASSDQLWVVQLGSFSDELNAKGLAHSVSQAGFKVSITPLFAKKGTVWRVRVGPYASRELAVQATAQLREKLGRDGLVMPK